jgi:hypothetical protein
MHMHVHEHEHEHEHEWAGGLPMFTSFLHFRGIQTIHHRYTNPYYETNFLDSRAVHVWTGDLPDRIRAS